MKEATASFLGKGTGPRAVKAEMKLSGVRLEGFEAGNYKYSSCASGPQNTRKHLNNDGVPYGYHTIL